MNDLMLKHWKRLKRSLGRRWREWRLPSGYIRLGTRYGGWWFDRKLVGDDPLVVDCGLGEDISFPKAFLDQFGGKVIGVEPNPRSLAYCASNPISGMEILPAAFWTRAGEKLSFHLPRPKCLPNGADGVSGSLLESHAYVEGGDTLEIQTVDLPAVLRHAGTNECDILKLDIEGAEYEVLSAMIDSGDLGRVRQLLVEFHHGVTHKSLADTESIVVRLTGNGFNLVHVEGRNYIFRRIAA